MQKTTDGRFIADENMPSTFAFNLRRSVGIIP